VDVNGYAPIHHASVTGNVSLLSSLLAVFSQLRVPLVDMRDKRGMTALHWAIQRAQGPAIKMLIENGASLLRQDAEGRDSLIHASVACAMANDAQKNFYHDMTRYLIQSGADVAQKDKNGAIALHYASESGDSQLVDILVEIGGSPVNAKDDAGENALFYALRESKIDAARRLIGHGVDLSSKNSSSENIVDFCRSLDYQDALEMFASILGPQQNATGGSDPMELSSSANMFGSATFNPTFNSQSNHLNR
jgi:ankyrin repeat protein